MARGKKIVTALSGVVMLTTAIMSGCADNGSLQPGAGQNVPGVAPTFTTPPDIPPYTPDPSQQPTGVPSHSYVAPTSSPTSQIIESGLETDGLLNKDEVLSMLQKMKTGSPIAPYAYRESAYGDYAADAAMFGWESSKIGSLCSVVDAAAVISAETLGDWRKENCDVISGTWRDPYSANIIVKTAGRYTSDDALYPDRIISTRQASYAGAVGLSAEDKKRFANDPLNIVMVSDLSANKKLGRNVVDWRPPKAGWCNYAKRWVQVKHKYNLILIEGEQERSTLKEMLNTCRK